MPDIFNLSPSEFERGYKTYQAYDPRGAIYKTATFLVEHFWGRPSEMADGMGVLLLTWNQAFYRYGSFEFARLEETLRFNMPVIKELRPRNIQSFVESDESIIKGLFLGFLEALRIENGKKKDCKSPVAVAKALHLLAPGFMPLWDDKIARAYGCYYNSNPEQKYVAFAHTMKSLSQQLHEQIPKDCDRTFLKLIDEYNYAKYTKGWI